MNAPNPLAEQRTRLETRILEAYQRGDSPEGLRLLNERYYTMLQVIFKRWLPGGRTVRGFDYDDFTQEALVQADRRLKVLVAIPKPIGDLTALVCLQARSFFQRKYRSSRDAENRPKGDEAELMEESAEPVERRVWVVPARPRDPEAPADPSALILDVKLSPLLPPEVFVDYRQSRASFLECLKDLPNLKHRLAFQHFLLGLKPVEVARTVGFGSAEGADYAIQKTRDLVEKCLKKKGVEWGMLWEPRARPTARSAPTAVPMSPEPQHSLSRSTPMIPSTPHLSEALLLHAARYRVEMPHEAAHHLDECPACVRSLVVFSAAVDASLEALLGADLLDEALETSVTEWLTGPGGGVPSETLRTLRASPAGRLLILRIALDLQALGKTDMEARLLPLGLSLPTWDEAVSEPGATSPSSPRRAPGQRVSPYWEPLALAAVVLLGVGLAWQLRPQRNEPAQPDVSVRSGAASTSLALHLEGEGYRQAQDGQWDLRYRLEHASSVPCKPGDRLRLRVSGEGTGVLMVWERLDGGPLRAPRLQHALTLNSARMPLQPAGSADEDWGLSVPAFTARYDLWVTFSRQAPEPGSYGTWLEALEKASIDSGAQEVSFQHVTCTVR